MKNRQHGAAGIIILILIVLASIGGFMYYKSNSSTATNAPACEDRACFDANFKTCTPSVFAVEAGGAGVQYEILSSGTEGCNMKFTYTKINMPGWENKPMTCDFSNKTTLENSVAKTLSGISDGSVVCSGPLYDIIKGE
ncbi:MAG: hypothetical protein V4576_00175 [Patescibacteria group bacterium]